MNNLILSEINIYPVKSLGGISLTSSIVEPRGLKYDRRWLLVDKNGIFMTQRDYPQMALIGLSINDNSIVAEHKTEKHKPLLSIPVQNESDERIEVVIWDDKCTALLVGKDYDDWFSEALKHKCRLVFMPDTERRVVEKKYITDEQIVSFADAYPFLLIGQASLDDLNKRLDMPLPMNRFRTNFVFSGGAPFEEDTWKNFTIGELKFRAVKPCARCVITTTDQETAVRSEEPLRTLSTFRRFGNKVLFGMNLIADSYGRIQIGDRIDLI